MGASSVQKVTVPVGPARARRRTLPQMAPIAIGCGVLVVIVRLLTPLRFMRKHGRWDRLTNGPEVICAAFNFEIQ